MKSLAILDFMILVSLGHFKGSEIIDIWGNTITPANHSVRLYVFRPEKAQANAPAIIICPGGSYHHLGMKHEGANVAKWLSSQGITAFVLQYRVALGGWQYPAMIQDLQRSIQIVRENAEYYGINPEAVGVMGFSAGGHLAGTAMEYYEHNYLAELGIMPAVSLKPDFGVMVYPVVSMHDSIAHQRSKKSLLGKNPDKELENLMSLEDNIPDVMPPVLIIHAKDDPVVDYRNSSYFYQNLKEKGKTADLIIYPTGGHGFGVKRTTKPITPPWQSDCLMWLKKQGLISE